MTYTFLKFWCDHRTSANTANYPTSHPSECDYYSRYNLFYFIRTPMWLCFSLAQYFLYLKLKLSLIFTDSLANFMRIRKKCYAKLSKWTTNRVSRRVNSNHGTLRLHWLMITLKINMVSTQDYYSLTLIDNWNS